MNNLYEFLNNPNSKKYLWVLQMSGIVSSEHEGIIFDKK